MKAQYLRGSLLSTLILCSVIMLTMMAFRDSSKTTHQYLPQVDADTTPKKSIHIDIDMEDLNKALKELNVELKGINWDDISKEVLNSLNSIDVDKIKKDVTLSIQNIDWDNIKREINNYLKDIKLDNIEIDIKNVTDSLNKSLNSEEFKSNMKKLDKIDMKKLNKELKKAKIEIEKSKKEIKINIDKNRNESNNETFVLPEKKDLSCQIENNVPVEERRFFFFI